MIVLDNLDNTAALNHGNAIMSRLSYTSGSNVAVNAGRILWQKENEWTSTASTQNSSLQLSTTNSGAMTTKMTISSSGNIGIGTTSPIARLSVYEGSLWLNGTSGGSLGSSAGVGLRLFYSVNDYGVLQAYDYGSSTAKNLVMQTSGGNVGIGTTNSISCFVKVSYFKFRISIFAIFTTSS